MFKMVVFIAVLRRTRFPWRATQWQYLAGVSWCWPVSRIHDHCWGSTL